METKTPLSPFLQKHFNAAHREDVPKWTWFYAKNTARDALKKARLLDIADPDYIARLVAEIDAAG